MDKPTSLVLFRRDLRLSDNLALCAAAQHGRVVAVYLPDDIGRPLGGAARWWRHHALAALTKDIGARGGRLIIRRGSALEVVRDLVIEAGATAVFWNRRYDPVEARTDGEMKTALRADGIVAESFDGALLHEPTRTKTGAGGHYKVFGAFARAVSSQDHRDPVAAPDRINWLSDDLHSVELDELNLLPRNPDWSGGLSAEWTPGEHGARERLEEFVTPRLDGYAEGRDVPGLETTSRLSPHLAHGEITPFQVLAALRGQDSADAAKARSELMWREFCYHLLFFNSGLATENYNKRFDSFPWRSDTAGLRRWQKGDTGYPVVDAGMRQLWQTGWMHNRVRMIVASFLAKHLMIDWRQGEQWFWDTLVDADPASNPANWQWVAGSGADAAPYFRVFNPILQGEKFDAAGNYVRQFVPEIASLPDKYLHRPFDAPKAELGKAGVKLGETYPVPVIEHKLARERALAGYRKT